MKIKSLLLGMMTCAALAACTNEDLVENEGGNGVDNSTAKAYIGIKLADPTNGFSRAADGGYDDGTSAEHNIQNIDFFFYKNGEFVTKGALATDEFDINGNPINGNGTNIEANVPAVVVLQDTQGGEGVEYPDQVLAFLNLPASITTDLETRKVDLETTLKTVKSISDISEFATNDKFIMTNSVYLNNNGGVQNAVPVSSVNFAQTAEAAKNNPITIYVERVAAKVKMEEKEGGADTPDIGINYNNASGYKLKLQIDSWGINAVNKTSYLVKQIDPSWELGWNWNNSGDFRSFWAKDTNYGSANYPANREDYTGKENNSPLEYRSWNDVVANDKSTQYCLENTMDAATAANENAVTYMVIAGHYQLVAPGASKGEDIDKNTKLYKYIDKFYLEEDLLKMIAEQASLYTFENNTWTKLDASNYQIVRASLYDGKAQLKAASGDFYTAKDENSKVSVEEANARLKENLGTFTAFAGGKTFFYTPIKHLNANKEQDGHIGIVRNHTYALTLNSITKLGHGVFNPDEEIIITPKEKEFYVAATLNILSWKVVNHDVDL